MRPPASHDRIEKGRVNRAPVALECLMEAKPLTASIAAITAGVLVFTHHVIGPGYLPPKLPPSLKPVDTRRLDTNDETYAGKMAVGREVFDEKRESATDINGKPATST